MKLCTKCGELVGDSRFYQDKRAKDGLTSACKRCVGKSQHAYRASEHGTAVRRALRERERKSLKGRARRAVHYARKHQKIVRGPCAVCGSTEKVEAHHHNGYAKERWLDVQWLCYPCHQRTE